MLHYHPIFLSLLILYNFPLFEITVSLPLLEIQGSNLFADSLKLGQAILAGKFLLLGEGSELLLLAIIFTVLQAPVLDSLEFLAGEWLRLNLIRGCLITSTQERGPKRKQKVLC